MPIVEYKYIRCELIVDANEILICKNIDEDKYFLLNKKDICDFFIVWGSSGGNFAHLLLDKIKNTPIEEKEVFKWLI
jgi:hypothetical protein